MKKFICKALAVVLGLITFDSAAMAHVTSKISQPGF
jgi:hypothetical protein